MLIFITCSSKLTAPGAGDAINILNNSVLSQIVVTNTVPLGDKIQKCKKLRVIDVSPTLAEAIRRTHNGESVRYAMKIRNAAGVCCDRSGVVLTRIAKIAFSSHTLPYKPPHSLGRVAETFRPPSSHLQGRKCQHYVSRRKGGRTRGTRVLPDVRASWFDDHLIIVAFVISLPVVVGFYKPETLLHFIKGAS